MEIMKLVDVIFWFMDCFGTGLCIHNYKEVSTYTKMEFSGKLHGTYKTG